MTDTVTTGAERLISEGLIRGWPMSDTPIIEKSHLRLSVWPDRSLIHALAIALRTSEEARMKAERERDDAIVRLHHLQSDLKLVRAANEAAETALADMWRERDASDKGILSLGEAATAFGMNFPSELKETLAAARSRAKPDGEEKKL